LLDDEEEDDESENDEDGAAPEGLTLGGIEGDEPGKGLDPLCM
jgi:hypothetical protein